MVYIWDLVHTRPLHLALNYLSLFTLKENLNSSLFWTISLNLLQLIWCPTILVLITPFTFLTTHSPRWMDRGWGHEKWQGLSFPMSFGLYFFFNTDMPYALYWCNITIMRETILQHSFIMVLFFNSTLPHMEKWNYKELIRFPAGFFVLLWLLFLFYVSTITSINYT